MPTPPTENKNTIINSKINAGGNVYVGDVTVINESKTPQYLPNHQSQIKNFFDFYLGTATSVVTFGGRGKELELLDKWLIDPKAPPYALVAAEAGRGKSALLTQWSQSLVERDLAKVVFIPVSIRFNTALSSVFFPALAIALAEIFGETIPQPNLSAAQWSSECLRYMQKNPPDGKPLLVIVDGLDEASDWKAGPDLFPISPPPGLRVIVSARYIEGDIDERGWMRRLGWKYAHHISLPPLTRQGVSDVLKNMGNPLSELGEKVDLVSELYRLSQGDPLLVCLYVEALLPNQESATALKPEDLPSIPEGLTGYFDRWRDEHKRLLERQGRTVQMEQADVENFFKVCAIAIGPLGRDDVAEIAGGALASGFRLKDIAKELGRLIIGDGDAKGYVFSHPRLGQFFQEEMTSAERSKWEERFLLYGRNTLDKLVKGETKTKNASHYVIQYYGAHLERSEATNKDLYALVSGAWLHAWEAIEGTTYAGFLNDVDRAWRCAESAMPRLTADDFIALIKCTLCQSSIAAQSSNIPPELLALCVQYNILSPFQALTIARQGEHLAKTLELLASTLPLELMEQALVDARMLKDVKVLTALAQRQEGVLKVEVMQEALEAVREIRYENDRAVALTTLASYLPETLEQTALTIAEEIKNPMPQAIVFAALSSSLPMARMQVREKVLEAAQKIENEQQQIDLWIILASRLADDLKTEIVQEVLIFMRELPLLSLYQRDQSERLYATALNQLAAYIPKDLQTEAVEMVMSMKNTETQLTSLTCLFPHLPEKLKFKVLPEMLQVGRAIEIKGLYANVLIWLIPYLPNTMKPDIVQEALKEARAIDDVERRPSTLSGLVPYLPKELHKELLEDIWKENSAWAQATILSSLAPRLSDDVLKEVFESTLALQEGDRTLILTAIISSLPEPLKNRAVYEVLKAVRKTDNEQYRKDAILKIAPHLSEEFLEETFEILQNKKPSAPIDVLIKMASCLPNEKMRAQATQEAFSAARAIHDEVARVNIMVALAKYLATKPELLLEALATIYGLNTEPEKAPALAAIVPFLPGELQEDVAEKALAMVDQLPQQFSTINPGAEVLAALLPYLSERLMDKALELGGLIKGNDSQVWALTNLAQYSPEAIQGKVVQEALATSRVIRNLQNKALAMAHIIHLLPEGQKTEVAKEALDTALQSRDTLTLAMVIRSVAPHISEKYRGEMLDLVLISLDDDETTWDVLQHIGSLLQTTELIKKAQEITSKMNDEDYRLAADLSLLPYSSDVEDMEEAVGLLKKINSEWIQIEALANLLPHLSDKLKGKAIQVTLSALPNFQNDWEKNAFEGLAPLLPEWVQANPAPGYSALKELLRTFATAPRPTYLPYLQMLLPFALALVKDDEKERAAAGIFQSIKEVGLWWP